jgi:hypothetical protein
MKARSLDFGWLRPGRGKSGLGVTAIGLLIAALLLVAVSVRVQVAILGVATSFLSGLLVDLRKRDEWQSGSHYDIRAVAPRQPSSQTADLNALWELVRDIATLRDCADPLLREHVVSSTAALIDEIRRLARGQIVFASTETWRAAYEKVLSEPSVDDYRSVAWVKSEDYWKDLPGQQSMRLNYDLIGRGVRIERIIIIGWNLWPPHVRVPLPRVTEWIEEQHYRGISVSLIREADLVNEQELLRDFGIYGERATGEQEIDEESRTVRFVLSFDQPSILLARDRWDRLMLFTIRYENLLDQSRTDR